MLFNKDNRFKSIGKSFILLSGVLALTGVFDKGLNNYASTALFIVSFVFVLIGLIAIVIGYIQDNQLAGYCYRSCPNSKKITYQQFNDNNPVCRIGFKFIEKDEYKNKCK